MRILTTRRTEIEPYDSIIMYFFNTILEDPDQAQLLIDLEPSFVKLISSYIQIFLNYFGGGPSAPQGGTTQAPNVSQVDKSSLIFSLEHCFLIIYYFSMSKAFKGKPIQNEANTLYMKSLMLVLGNRKSEEEQSFIIKLIHNLLCILNDHPILLNKIIDEVYYDRLIDLQDTNNRIIQSQIIKIIGLLATGVGFQLDILLGCSKLINFVKSSIQSQDHLIRKNCCFTIANLATGSQEQIHALFTTGLLQKVSQILSSDTEEVRTQAIFAVGNCLEKCQQEELLILFENQLMPGLISSL